MNSSMRARALSALDVSKCAYVRSSMASDVPPKRATSVAGMPLASAHESPLCTPRPGQGSLTRWLDPVNPLVSSEQAQKAVEHLRDRGMTYRQISRLAGVSVEAVHRSAGGVGRVRQSTEQALLHVAAQTNGKKVTS
jgi:hypothetical protein